MTYEVYRDENRKQQKIGGDFATYEEACEFRDKAQIELEKEPGYRREVMSRAVLGVRQQKPEPTDNVDMATEETAPGKTDMPQREGS